MGLDHQHLPKHFDHQSDRGPEPSLSYRAWNFARLSISRRVHLPCSTQRFILFDLRLHLRQTPLGRPRNHPLMGLWSSPPPEHLHGLRKRSPIMIVSPITQPNRCTKLHSEELSKPALAGCVGFFFAAAATTAAILELSALELPFFVASCLHTRRSLEEGEGKQHGIFCRFSLGHAHRKSKFVSCSQ